MRLTLVHLHIECALEIFLDLVVVEVMRMRKLSQVGSRNIEDIFFSQSGVETKLLHSGGNDHKYCPLFCPGSGRRPLPPFFNYNGLHHVAFSRI